MNYRFKTRGVCASTIEFELNDGIVSNVVFYGGCNGNLKAISKLIDGMEATKVISILKGNVCGFKHTSCADQLSIALENALSEKNEG